MQKVLIQCQPSQLDSIKESNYNWCYTPELGEGSIDVILSDVKHNVYLNRNEFCIHYGFNPNEVDNIEVIY